MTEGNHCYDGEGCVHLRRRYFADGTMYYHCPMSPSLIIGESDPQVNDVPPKRCEHFASSGSIQYQERTEETGKIKQRDST